jgi:nucleotidyltransferase substrate binding protein (TIGR01987 family)
LALHTLQKTLNKQGSKVSKPRDIFRVAADWGYIDDPLIWFKFLEERNQTSHVYREDILAEVYNIIPKFLPELNKLIKKLQEE